VRFDRLTAELIDLDAIALELHLTLDGRFHVTTSSVVVLLIWFPIQKTRNEPGFANRPWFEV
jgi:hypothetical protein